MVIKTKRIYEPAAKADGARILVDRLWPRGISKAKARVAYWAKDLAPSNELRKWFHGDPEKRFAAFKRKYRAELRPRKKELVAALRPYRRSMTLVTAVKNLDRSHIPVLRSFLK